MSKDSLVVPATDGTYVDIKPKDVIFETVKSTTLVASIIGALTYAGAVVFRGLDKRGWSLKPEGTILAATTILGGFFGLYSGYSKYVSTRIFNDRATVINRHKDNLQVQADIVSQIGDLRYDYKPGNTENIFGTAGNLGFWGWLTERAFFNNTALRTLSNVAFWGGYAGKYTLNTIGKAKAIGAEKESVLHAEKIALERAAGLDQQPPGR